MKENSIERDIHLLESYAGMTHKMNDNQGRPKLDQAIEHILQDYKRVLKENEELRESNKKLYEIGQEMCKQDKYTSENYISVQKVKDKIEELNKQLEEDLQDGIKVNSNRFIIICQCKSCLQELLESEE